MVTNTSAQSTIAQSSNNDHREVNSYQIRLIRGLESSLSEKSFQQTTIAEIVRRAHTSRRTFYEYFKTKEECLIALYRQAGEEEAQAVSNVDGTAPWQAQVSQAIRAWIAVIDSRPTIMLSWLRDLPLLGPAGAEFRRGENYAFIKTIQATCCSKDFLDAGGTVISRERALVIAGAMERLAADAVENGHKLNTYTDEAISATLALISAS